METQIKSILKKQNQLSTKRRHIWDPLPLKKDTKKIRPNNLYKVKEITEEDNQAQVISQEKEDRIQMNKCKNRPMA